MGLAKHDSKAEECDGRWEGGEGESSLQKSADGPLRNNSEPHRPRLPILTTSEYILRLYNAIPANSPVTRSSSSELPHPDGEGL